MLNQYKPVASTQECHEIAKKSSKSSSNGYMLPQKVTASLSRGAKTFVVIKVPDHARHFHPVHHLHSSF